MNDKFKDWVDLDVDHVEPKPLSSEHKRTLKSHVLSNTKTKKRFKPQYVAAAAVLGFSVMTASFMSLPAVANQIPFIQSIVSYFEDDALPNTYSDLATIVNQVQSSNGIDVMIENAVYDGTNIFLTYAIQTEKELGDNPRVEGFIDVDQSTGMGGTGSIEKIKDTTYVGVEKVTPHFNDEPPEEILVRWEPKAFENFQANSTFEGDWEFEFTLSQLSTDLQLLNETAAQDGITLVMKSLKQSEMTAVLQYEYFVEEEILQDWPLVSIEMTSVTDNLGNTYEMNGNGGVSHDNGVSNEWRATVYSLDPNASSLTFTPEVYYSKGSGELVETKKLEPITIDLE